MKRVDLVGQRFGLLVVVSYAENQQWTVRCDCGTEKVVAGNHLRRGATKSCGCSSREWTRTTQNRNRVASQPHPFPNLVGRVFGQLTVMTQEPSEQLGRRCYSRWKVRCTCGQEKTVRGEHLTSQGLQSCGCLKTRKLPVGVSASNQLLARYKQQAASRGYAWDLSDAQAFELFSGTCHYCGQAPAALTTGRALNGAFPYNGIDRKDNTQGYTSTNVVSCCKVCNRAKNTMSYGDFLEHLQRISRFWGQVAERVCP